MIMLTSLTIHSLSLTANGTCLLQFQHATSLQSSILITFLDDNFILCLPSSSFKPFQTHFHLYFHLVALLLLISLEIRSNRRELTQAPTNTYTYFSASVGNYSHSSMSLDELSCLQKKTGVPLMPSLRLKSITLLSPTQEHHSAHHYSPLPSESHFDSSLQKKK